MTHKLYRDKDLEGYKVIELDLDQEMVVWLEDRARENGVTVDEIVEEILSEAIRDWEVDDSLD